MADNNFLVWNPASINQLTDAQYLVDSMRTGGAISGIMPSDLANKLFYQVTMMASSIASMMAAKGFEMKDTTQAALITALTNILTKADFGDSANTVCQGNDVRIDGLVATPLEINTVAQGEYAKNNHTHIEYSLRVTTRNIYFNSVRSEVVYPGFSPRIVIAIGSNLSVSNSVGFYANTNPPVLTENEICMVVYTQPGGVAYTSSSAHIARAIDLSNSKTTFINVSSITPTTITFTSSTTTSIQPMSFVCMIIGVYGSWV